VSKNGSQMEIVIIILFVACVIWLAMKMWNREDEFKEASLARAWRRVLRDPNYEKRRPLEERKYAAMGKAQTLGDEARETSQS
jgi:hypothetical protein